MIKDFTIRIDDTTLQKLHIVASHESRSASKQVLVLIREAVEAYEKKHGEIKSKYQ